jgi:hypothetical protein
MKELNFYYSYKYGKGNYLRGKKICKYFLLKDIKINLKKFNSEKILKEKNIYDLHPNDLLQLKNKKIFNSLIINSFNNEIIQKCINILPQPSINFNNNLENTFKGQKYLVTGIDTIRKKKITILYDLYLFLGMDKNILKKTKKIFDKLKSKGFKIFSPGINNNYFEGEKFIKNILSCKQHIISGGLTRYDLMSLGVNYNYIGINSRQNNINKICEKLYKYGNCLGTINKYNLEKIKFLKKKSKIKFNGEVNTYKLYVKKFL